MIDDPSFDGTASGVRDHYERLAGVYESLGRLGDEYVTIGFAGNDGWYQYRQISDVGDLEEGWVSKARCTTLDRDWNQILDEQLGSDGREREIFNISSWKTPGSIYSWTKRKEKNDDEIWEGKSKPTPGYEALRGFGFWCDLDLTDKAGRSSLTDEELEIVERTQARVIEEVADFYGVDTSAIYGLDSGGGAYIYAPPETALPIAEYLNADARKLIFNDMRERMRDGLAKGELDGFDGIWPTVIDEIDGADELLDPDWIQNVNRQTKAPGAIHHKHDLVVTPLRERNPKTGAIAGAVDYSPTLVSDVDSRLIAQLETWADGLTAIEHKDAVSTFVKNLYPEIGENDGWQSIIDARLETLQKREEARRERREAVAKKIDEWDGDSDTDLRDAHKERSGSSLRSSTGQYSGAVVTDDPDEIPAAVETIDVAQVVRNHTTHLKQARSECDDCEICEAIKEAPQTDKEPCGECHACYGWDTAARSGEITFDPSWRGSGSGKSCAIPTGSGTFVDNGCDAGGGPVKAYALGEIDGYDDPTDDLTDVWGTAVDSMRDDGYNIPVYVPDVDDDENEYDETPLWALRNAAVALEVVEPDGFVERDAENGTYIGFPDAETYNSTLEELASLGISHGRQPLNAGEENPIKETVVKHSDEYDSVEEVPDNVLNAPKEGDSNSGEEHSREEEREGRTGAPTWEDVRMRYRAAEENKDVSKGPARQAAQERLQEGYDWMYVKESERLWVYDEDAGTYNEWGELEIGEILVDELREYYARSEKSEIIDRISQKNSAHREKLNARSYDDPLLCVGNGVVNLRTGELYDHSPEYYFVRGLEWDYPTEDNGVESDKETVLEFLDGVTERKADRKTLLDHLGHGLMPGHPYRAFIVCYGPGGNGKTQVSSLFRAFVGEENAASVEIDGLVNDDFATSDLVGKFLNWGDDMKGDGGGTLEDISILKKASGGSYLRSNEKWEKTFDFKNQAAMFFSANEPPRFGEAKPSIKERLYPIEMPFRFLDPDGDEYDPDNPLHKEKIPNYAEKLIDDDAVMRGLLELAVEHAQKLKENRGAYSQPESPDERFKRYHQEADPLMRFSYTAFEGADGDMMVRKDDAYRVYYSFTQSWEERSAGERGFKREFPKITEFDIESAQSRALSTEDGERDKVPAWKRLTWTEAAREHMPDWMVERYEEHWEEGETQEEQPDGESSDERLTLSDVSTGIHQEPMTATIAEKLDAPEWLEGKGHLVDDGAIREYHVENENPLVDVEEGEVVTIENFKVVETQEGVVAIIISGITEVSTPEATANTITPEKAATDGGESDDDKEGPRAKVDKLVQKLRTLDKREYAKGELVAQVDRVTDVDDPDRAEEIIEKAVNRRALARTEGGYEVL